MNPVKVECKRGCHSVCGGNVQEIDLTDERGSRVCIIIQKTPLPFIRQITVDICLETISISIYTVLNSRMLVLSKRIKSSGI